MEKAGNGENFIDVLTELEEAIVSGNTEAKENPKGFFQSLWQKFIWKKQANEKIDAGVNPEALAPAGAVNPDDPLGLLGG